MSIHLEECEFNDDLRIMRRCICPALRACEARVRGKNTYLSGVTTGYNEGYKEAEAATLNAILRVIDRNKHESSYCSVIHACDIIQEIELIRQSSED